MTAVRTATGLAALVFAIAIGSPHQSLSARVPVPGPLTCDGFAATIVGTSGDDVIAGTDGDDVIVGLAGHDEIRAGAGDDIICGGPGDDNIAGQGGDDLILGEQGHDFLDGGEGGCCFEPTNTGDDELHGGPGNDILHTSDFPVLGNQLFGEQGEDELFVWSGGWAYGGNGDDTIFHFAEDAVLDGGNGDDSIVNADEAFSDETVTMLGGNGDDELISEDATATIHMDGGRGNDTCGGGATTEACESSLAALVRPSPFMF